MFPASVSRFIPVLFSTLLVGLGGEAVVAQAAAAEPREPVFSCEVLGKGFVQYPGSDTCFFVGLNIATEYSREFVEDELDVRVTRNPVIVPGDAVGEAFVILDTADVSSFPSLSQYRVNARTSFTAATPTEHGPLVSYFGVRFLPEVTGEVRTLVSPGPVRPITIESNLDVVTLEYAWIKWAGITAGLHSSAFNFTPGLNYNTSYATDRKLFLFSYTTPIHDTAALTLSLEDNAARRVEAGDWANYGRVETPDFVAALNLAREWGNLHAAAAVHRISDAVACCKAVPPDIYDHAYGWAATGGVEYRMKFGEQYGRILLSGAITDGAVDYLGAPYFATDYITDRDGSVVTTRGVSAVASYEHVWNPSLKSALSVSVYETETELSNLRWQVRGLLAQAGVEYMPTPNLVIGTEIGYTTDEARYTYRALPLPPGVGTAVHDEKVGFFSAMIYARRQIGP